MKEIIEVFTDMENLLIINIFRIQTKNYDLNLCLDDFLMI